MNSTMVSSDKPVEESTKLSAQPVNRPLVRATDRCDRCGAQGYHRAQSNVSGLELIFCHHHGKAYEASLGAQNFSTSDQSKSLYDVSKPDSSAAA